jgi:hypothetical protein
MAPVFRSSDMSRRSRMRTSESETYNRCERIYSKGSEASEEASFTKYPEMTAQILSNASSCMLLTSESASDMKCERIFFRSVLPVNRN